MDKAKEASDAEFDWPKTKNATVKPGKARIRPERACAGGLNVNRILTRPNEDKHHASNTLQRLRDSAVNEGDNSSVKRRERQFHSVRAKNDMKTWKRR